MKKWLLMTLFGICMGANASDALLQAMQSNDQQAVYNQLQQKLLSLNTQMPATVNKMITMRGVALSDKTIIHSFNFMLDENTLSDDDWIKMQQLLKAKQVQRLCRPNEDEERLFNQLMLRFGYIMQFRYQDAQGMPLVNVSVAK